MIHRIRNDESGQILVMALGFLAFIGVIAVFLLDYAATNLRATATFRTVRAVEYAGDGAVDGAINKLRHDPLTSTCAAGKTFYLTTLNMEKVAVECVSQVVSSSPREVRATFTARCWVDPAATTTTTTTATAPCPANRELLVARVLFKDVGSPPSVRTTVESWSVK